jgi:elongation factor P
MKIDTSEAKRGTILNIEGQLYKIVDVGHTHMGRGGATYSFKVKNVVTGAANTFTYKAGTTLEKADVNMQNAVYLYSSGSSYSFMENDTGEIYEIDQDEVSDIIPYLKENLDCFLMIYQGNVIGVILPTTIQYTIIETVP